MTKIYIDENFAPQLASGLDVFQNHLNLKEKNKYQVLSIKTEFGEGVEDEVWIPIAGHQGSIVITQDIKIQTTRHQRDLYHKFNLGVFFIKAPSNKGFSFWEMVQHIIKRWEEIKLKSGRTRKPFAYLCNCTSKFKELD
jgi:hypothetical protein